MRRIFSFILFVPLFVIAQDKTAEKYEGYSLCTANDTVFFSCSGRDYTKRAYKRFSLRGKVEKDIHSLYYRFATTDEIEMEYPNGKDKGSSPSFNLLNVAIINLHIIRELEEGVS